MSRTGNPGARPHRFDGPTTVPYWPAGNCAGTDPGMYDDAGKPEDVAAAQESCVDCPLLVQCKAYIMAVEAGEPADYRWGVWAATLPEERADLDTTPRRRGAGKQPFEHGTERGARNHRRRGQKPCQRCMDAERRASQDRRDRAAVRAYDRALQRLGRDGAGVAS